MKNVIILQFYLQRKPISVVNLHAKVICYS